MQKHQEQLPEGVRLYGLFREDWPGLGLELEPDDPKQGNRIQKVPGQVVDGGRMLLGKGLKLLQGPFGSPTQREQVHEMDAGQQQQQWQQQQWQQQQWQQHERQQWQSTPTTQFTSTETDVLSPTAHPQEMLAQLPSTQTSPQPPYFSADSPRLYHSQLLQDPSNAEDWHLRRDSIASNARLSTRSGLGSG